MRNSILFVALWVFALDIAAPSSLAEERASWKAGLAKTRITPDKPLWMGGFGARTNVSQGTLQELYAGALALDNGSRRPAVLVTADIVGFRAVVGKNIAERAEKQYGLPRARLILSSSHTQSGPLLADPLSIWCRGASAPSIEEKIVRKVHELVATARGTAETPPIGYQLAWSDEFDGGTLDMNKWSYRGLGRRHDALNVTDAVSVGGGQLTITTYTSGGKHCTGMIGTEGKFERRFGYWEARLQFEGAPGMWSAFWIQTPTFGRPGARMVLIDEGRTTLARMQFTTCTGVGAMARHFGGHYPLTVCPRKPQGGEAQPTG